MTFNINITRDYHEHNLDNKLVCSEIAKLIGVIEDDNIVLDINDCLIGYNATCTVIDALITSLLARQGSKTLTIVTDLVLPSSLLIPLLFKGSSFVDNINTNDLVSYDVIKTALIDALGDNDIKIYIELNGNRLEII
jgi:hypothetical protein